MMNYKNLEVLRGQATTCTKIIFLNAPDTGTKQWETRFGSYAALSLAGPACKFFGTDLLDLKLEVETRLVIDSILSLGHNINVY
jgi:hypothetical protein